MLTKLKITKSRVDRIERTLAIQARSRTTPPVRLIDQVDGHVWWQGHDQVWIGVCAQVCRALQEEPI